MPFDGLETPLNYLSKFDQVIDLIEAPSQWIKHTYRSPWGGYCLKEALNTVGVAEVFEPIILKVAGEKEEREFCCIESFNDCPQTTHDDVLTVLRTVRADIVAGKVRLPSHASAKPAATWKERHAQAEGGWASTLWQKLFA